MKEASPTAHLVLLGLALFLEAGAFVGQLLLDLLHVVGLVRGAGGIEAFLQEDFALAVLPRYTRSISARRAFCSLVSVLPVVGSDWARRSIASS